MMEVIAMNWNPFRISLLGGRGRPVARSQAVSPQMPQAGTGFQDAALAAIPVDDGPFSAGSRARRDEASPVTEVEEFKAARARMEVRLRDLGKLRNRKVA